MEAWRDELYHWGIQGMKWGVRRFQNEDGSLTAAGRERYGVGDGDDEHSQQQNIRPDDSYNEELDRISATAQYETLMNDEAMQQQIDAQRRRVRNIAIGVGAALAVTAGGIIIGKKFKEAKDQRKMLAEAIKKVGDSAVTKDALKDYVKNDTLKNYAKNDAFKDYVKNDTLKGYVQSNTLSNTLKGYAKSDAFKDYMKTGDFKDATKDFAKSSDLSKYLKVSDVNERLAKVRSVVDKMMR